MMGASFKNARAIEIRCRFPPESAPFNSKLQRASYMSFMGKKGMDYLVELNGEAEDWLE